MAEEEIRGGREEKERGRESKGGREVGRERGGEERVTREREREREGERERERVCGEHSRRDGEKMSTEITTPVYIISNICPHGNLRD